ncbi:MAG: protease HtpX [Bdellovibrionales bacterium]|nr:protease HtpX [Bdellovibrionales bacterium]
MPAWFKRVSVLLSINFLIIATISVLTSALGLRSYLSARGIDYYSLAAFCLIWGMGGAFISLGLSRFMAKMLWGVQVLDPQKSHDPQMEWLMQTVYHLARAAGLTTMPEVGIYESPEVNAFATGPMKNRALVAVSTGLLERLNRDQIEGVLGHEIAHVANGDMVTMTLVQGVVNAFVMFLSRILAFAIAQVLRGRDREDRGENVSPLVFSVLTVLLEMILMILASIVVSYVSRLREYRADHGGARLAGREKMISALEGLRRTYELIDTRAQPAVQSLKISGRGKIFALFSSHPSLEDRIARLESATNL